MISSSLCFFLVLTFVQVFVLVRSDAGDWKLSFPPWNASSTAPTLTIPIVLPLTKHACGPSRYMMMRIATSHINSRDPTLAPSIASLTQDFQLRYEVLDNEGTAVGTVAALIELQQKLGGDTLKVVLGPNGSGASKGAAPFLAVFGTPLLSWAATSADLSNKATYPNFFRVVSPDSLRMTVLMRFVQFLDFTSMNVLYLDYAYNIGEKDDLVAAMSDLNTEDPDYELSLSQTQVVRTDSPGELMTEEELPLLRSALDSLKRSVVRVIVCLSYGETSYSIFSEVEDRGMMSQSYVWLGSDGLSQSMLAGNVNRVEQVHGTMFIEPLSVGETYSLLQELWEQLMPLTEVTEFETLSGYCGDVTCDSLAGDFSGWTRGTHDTTLACTSYTALAYDAMLTLAIVADDLMTTLGVTDPEQLTTDNWMAGMQNLTLRTEAIQGLSGEVTFNENQERDMPMNIKNWRAGYSAATVVASWSGLTGFAWAVGETVYWPGFSEGIEVVSSTTNPFPTSVELGVPPACESGSVFDTSTGDCRTCPAGSYAPDSTDDTIVTQCVLCGRGSYSDNAGFTECERCPAGTASGLGSDNCTECEAGTFAQEGSEACEACSAGTYSSSGAPACSDCPAGTTSPTGAALCETCPKGHFAATEGSSTCQNCTTGRYGSYEGLSECVACSEGQFAEEAGAESCRLCSEEVLSGSTTQLLGAGSSDLCICPSGMYRARNESKVCEQCGDGQICNTGSDLRNLFAALSVLNGDEDAAFLSSSSNYPTLEEDYFATVEAPMSVYKCGVSGACPGGLPGVCTGGRIGLTCSHCPDSFWLQDDVCHECQGGEGFINLLIFVLVLFPAATAFHMSTNRPTIHTSRTFLFMAALIGMLANVVFTIAVFGTIRMDWPSPVGPFFDFLNFVKLDVDRLGMGCVFRNNSYSFKYIFKLLVYPVVLGLIVVGSLLTHLLPNVLPQLQPPALLAGATGATGTTATTAAAAAAAVSGVQAPTAIPSSASLSTVTSPRSPQAIPPLWMSSTSSNSGVSKTLKERMLVRLRALGQLSAFRAAALENSAGAAMSAVFVPIGLVSLDGFRCFSSPNGKSLLLADTSIVCWEGGVHLQLLVLSVIAILLFPLAFLSITCYVACWHGQLSARYGTAFTSRIRFLSDRMHPQRVLFGFFLIVRNFLVSLIPCIVANQHQDKVILLSALYIIWLVIQSHSHCWRFDLLNLFDSAISGGLITLLVSIALVGSDEEVSKQRLGWSIIGIAVMMVLVLVVMIVVRFIQAMMHREEYSVFISHHKAGAAVFARHLKMLLESPAMPPPFLDVDELDNLDNLPFAVQASRRVLIVLTPEIFSRPWCAIEMVSAWHNATPIVLGQINDEVVSTKFDELRDIIDNFSAADEVIFSQSGISVEMLMAAYEHISALTPFSMPLKHSHTAVWQGCMKKILAKDYLKWVPHRHSPDPGRCVNIVFDTKDDVECSTAQVAGSCFQRSGWTARICTSHHSEEVAGHPLIIFVSKGLVVDPVALGYVVEAYRYGPGIATAMGGGGFTKPDQVWFARLREGSILSPADMVIIDQIAQGVTSGEVAMALLPIFQILAWEFRPEQNYLLMLEQAKVLELRVEREARKMAVNMRATNQSNFGNLSSMKNLFSQSTGQRSTQGTSPTVSGARSNRVQTGGSSSLSNNNPRLSLSSGTGMGTTSTSKRPSLVFSTQPPEVIEQDISPRSPHAPLGGLIEQDGDSKELTSKFTVQAAEPQVDLDQLPIIYAAQPSPTSPQSHALPRWRLQHSPNLVPVTIVAAEEANSAATVATAATATVSEKARFSASRSVQPVAPKDDEVGGHDKAWCRI